MAAAPDPLLDASSPDACERVGAALRRAWHGAEDAPLNDETQRLMLHLSVEPPQPQAIPIRREAQAASRRPSLMRRLFGRKAATKRV